MRRRIYEEQDILNSPSADNRQVMGSDSRQPEEIVHYSASIPLITTLSEAGKNPSAFAIPRAEL